MARPRRQINVEQLERLAERRWTIEEIAAFFRVSQSTIERRFAAKIKESRHRGTAKLRDLQWALAAKLHPGMLIHLGRHYLGQTKDEENLGVAEQNEREVVYKTRWGSAVEPPSLGIVR